MVTFLVRQTCLIVGLFTPRGDGNWLSIRGPLVALDIVGLFTPRGDGNTPTPMRTRFTILSNCWTPHPERGRKPKFVLPGSHGIRWQIVGLFTPRGDGNRLAIGHKGVGRERVVGSFTPKRSRAFTAAPSRIFTLRQSAAALR